MLVRDFTPLANQLNALGLLYSLRNLEFRENREAVPSSHGLGNGGCDSPRDARLGIEESVEDGATTGSFASATMDGGLHFQLIAKSGLFRNPAGLRFDPGGWRHKINRLGLWAPSPCGRTDYLVARISRQAHPISLADASLFIRYVQCLHQTFRKPECMNMS